jgi:hypothetical protein
VVPGWSLSTATWTSSASRYIRGSPRPRLPGAVGSPTVVGDGDDDVIVGALSGELDVAQSPLVSVLCGVDQCLVEAKARSSAAAFDSPVFEPSSLSAVARSTQPRSPMGSSRTTHRRGRNESRVRDQVWRALWRVPANRTLLTVGRTLTCSPRSRGLMVH